MFIVVADDGEPEIHEESPPGWRGATNNQMELQAMIEALKLATGRRPPVDPDRYSRIVVYTGRPYFVLEGNVCALLAAKVPLAISSVSNQGGGVGMAAKLSFDVGAQHAAGS